MCKMIQALAFQEYKVLNIKLSNYLKHLSIKIILNSKHKRAKYSAQMFKILKTEIRNRQYKQQSTAFRELKYDQKLEIALIKIINSKCIDFKTKIN